MAEPFWSVIVPVKGVGPYLRESVRSAAAAWLGGGEILIQENPSAETAPGQVTAGDISYELNATDLGCYGSINAAIKRARGEFVHVLHDDDWVLPDFYDTMRNVCEALPADFGVASCAYANYDAGTLRVPRWLSERPAGPAGDWLARQFPHGNPLQVPAVVFRRGVFGAVGPFREDMPYAGDWEMYARVVSRFDWWHEPADLARYRVHLGQRCHAMLRDGRAARDCLLARRLAAEYLRQRKVVTA